MLNPDYQILLYYLYTPIENPEQFAKDQQSLCQDLHLTGRIIVAKEGLNGTVEGLKEDTEKYIQKMQEMPQFSKMHFKKSVGTGSAFPKLSIKVRSEIVSGHLGAEDLNPSEVTGKYLTPEDLHDWIHSGRKFYLVDMRNDYEHEVGYFKNSILAPFENFRDLHKVLPILEDLKDQTIVTICTGGVRCEKASGFLVKHGFKDVYQLYGGIVSYMEKYPNQDFLGKLYVFDGRVTMGFNIDAEDHVVVGKCRKCGQPADNYYDCKNIHCQGHRHFISCDSCIIADQGFCSKDCVTV